MGLVAPTGENGFLVVFTVVSCGGLLFIYLFLNNLSYNYIIILDKIIS